MNNCVVVICFCSNEIFIKLFFLSLSFSLNFQARNWSLLLWSQCFITRLTQYVRPVQRQVHWSQVLSQQRNILGCFVSEIVHPPPPPNLLWKVFGKLESGVKQSWKLNFNFYKDPPPPLEGRRGARVGISFQNNTASTTLETSKLKKAWLRIT